MEESAYKRLHSAWISSNTGSSMEDSLITNLAAPLMVFIAGASQHMLPHRVFIREFTLLVIPILANVTCMSYSTHLIPALIVAVTLIYCLSHQARCSYKVILSSPPEKKPTWITNFRACTSIISTICILAVDLNIFPRKFAKTEVSGFGLMDLGVGIYVICHGLVHCKSSSIWRETQATAVLVLLGLIRLLCVKMLGYQEHVSEYGLHWNFFFTLASCRIIVACVSHFQQSQSLILLTLLSGTLHHTILVYGGQDWVLSSKSRVNLADANREGITSILGYVTIFYASLTFRNHINSQSTGKALRDTALFSFCGWVGTYLASEHVGISRRLCNVGYIAWTWAIASSMIFILMWLDILLRRHLLARVPDLLSLINRRGLLFFLLGNICTGLINIYLQTLLLSTWQSYFVLVGYIFLVTFVTNVIDKLINR